MSRRRRLVVLVGLCVALGAGCGDDDDKASGGGNDQPADQGDCKDADAALKKAARDHVGPLKVAEDGEGKAGSVDKITVETCRTDDANATATVTVYGLRDDSIRDVRHRLRLIKVGGLWQVTDDLDNYVCQQGRGQQEFAGSTCK